MTDRATSAEPLPEPAQPPPSPPRAVMTDRGTSAEREVEVTVTTVVEPMDDTSMEAPVSLLPHLAVIDIFPCRWFRGEIVYTLVASHQHSS